MMCKSTRKDFLTERETEYNYIRERVEYPKENGYRMEDKQLPEWMWLVIEESAGTKQLFVHSRLHTNRRVKCGPDYGLDYTDRDIIQDQSGEIYRRWIK